MNSIEYEELLKSKINKEGAMSLLINGDWGIGKTFVTQRVLKDAKNLDYIYVSVFGKKTLQEVNSEIIKKILLPTFCKIKPSVGNNFFKDITTQMGKDIISKKTGISFDLISYLEKISIESINLSDKNYIFVIDDIERKSDDYSIKELFGIIEKLKDKSKVIILVNKQKMNESDKEILEKFKEKVIDYEYLFDKIDEKTVMDIVEDDSNVEIKEEIKKFLINKKYKIEKMNNLRIIKKTIMLLNQLHTDLKNIITLPIEIDKNIINEALEVILLNNKVEDKKSNNIDNKELHDKILDYYLHNKIDKEYFEFYFEKSLPLNRDLNKLWRPHLLTPKEYSETLNNFREKIRQKDTDYFKKQKYVISVFFYIESLNIPKIEIAKKELKVIADMLYTPVIDDEKPLIHKTEYFDEKRRDIYEEPFIQEINELNKEKFNKYCKENFMDLFLHKKYEKCKSIIDKTKDIYDNIYLDILLNPLFEDKIMEEYWEVLLRFYGKNTSKSKEIIEHIEKKSEEKDEYKYRIKKLLKIFDEIDEENYEEQYMIKRMQETGEEYIDL